MTTIGPGLEPATVQGGVVLRADPERAHLADATGIYVRARRGDRWCPVDVAELDRESLLAWFWSRGQSRVWLEGVVLGILGHPLPAPPAQPIPVDETETRP